MGNVNSDPLLYVLKTPVTPPPVPTTTAQPAPPGKEIYMQFNMLEALKTPTIVNPKEATFSEWWEAKLKPQGDFIIRRSQSYSEKAWDTVFYDMQLTIGHLEVLQSIVEKLDKAIESQCLGDCLSLMDDIDNSIGGAGINS